MRKTLRNLFATLVLAALLAFSIARLPNEPGNVSTIRLFVEEAAIELRWHLPWPGSKVWSFVYDVARQVSRRPSPFSHHSFRTATRAEFVRGAKDIGDAWVLADIREDTDRFRPKYAQADQYVWVYLVERTDRNGFWAPMLSVRRFGMDVLPGRANDTIPTGSNRDDLRRAYAQFLASRPGFANDAARLLQGETVHRSIIWTGVLHNIATLIVAALFFRSLAWVPEIPRRIRRRRSENLLRRRLCPACAYPIAGLTAQTCPECGAPLPATTASPTATEPPATQA